MELVLTLWAIGTILQLVITHLWKRRNGKLWMYLLMALLAAIWAYVMMIGGAVLNTLLTK